MFKNIFQKITGIIQWTKKWHFFHLILVPPFVANCLLNVYQIFALFDNYPDAIYGFLCFNILGYIIIFKYLLFCPCLLVYITVLIYIWIKKKPLHISNDFLLHNRIYNFIFILAILQLFLYIVSLIIANLYLINSI